MTFNNIEIPINSYDQRGSNWFVYDGPDTSLIHDGLNRYLYIKSLKTAIRFKEPNTLGSDTAFVIGANATNVYIVNPTLSQVRSISTGGISLNEVFYNLNDFNKYKDITYTTNPTVNTFVATCGNVNDNLLVIGGYLTNISPGLSIPTQASTAPVPEGCACYMYSDNSGASWQGPFFPFIRDEPFNLLPGRPLNALYVNDNWVFYAAVDLGGTTASNLFFVQSLGVDLAGDPKADPYLDTPGALLTNWQLPMVFFDDKIFFQNTFKTGYHTYDFVDDNFTFTVQPAISSFTIVQNELRITTLLDCNPIVIAAEGQFGSIRLTTFEVDSVPYNIDITLSNTFIDESEEGLFNPIFTGGFGVRGNSDHTLHSTVIYEPVQP